jgi:cell division protein FtsA
VPDQFIVGVDIGASKLCAAVALRERNGAVRYVGHGSAPSAGLRGGEVVDPNALSTAFKRAVEEARYLIGTPVHDIVVSVSGARLEPIDRMGGLDLSGGRPITHQDVVQAIGNSRGSDPAGLQTVHRVVRGMSLDGDPVTDPTGRTGRRLDVWTRDYAVPAQLVERLRRSADAASVRIHTLIPEGVAAAAAALTDDERDAGVVLVDIGSATTDIAAYVHGDLQHIAGFPLGGHHITTDLASVLDIPIDEAEDLKRRHGAIGEDNDEELFEWTPRTVAALQRLASEGEVPGAAVRSIAAARVIQIIDRVKAVLDGAQLTERLRAGAVLTGGGSQLHGTEDIARAILRLPVRSGAVLPADGFPAIADPTVSASVGLIRYCAARSVAPLPPRAESRSLGATAFVHPLVMQVPAPFRGSGERHTREEGQRSAHSVTPVATMVLSPQYSAPARARASRSWGRSFRAWMREFVPARMDE